MSDRGRLVIAKRNAFRLAAAIGLGAVAAMAATLLPRPAVANPTFARITGHTCAVCHVPAQEPRLNPTGEEFKSCGFSFCKGPPSASVQPVPPAPAPQPPPRPVAMCDTFACNHHTTCVFIIVSRDGASRNIRVERGDSYKVRNVKPDDQYCTIEADNTCNLKAVHVKPCD